MASKSSSSGPLIRDISDPARWVAVYRALETERPDALFRDPFARRLAGPRGEAIAASFDDSPKNRWPWTTRTYLFDQFITEQVRDGVDMVVNLAAGLDARPYRMVLPPTLRWVEIDLPELIAYKEEVLAGEKPNCRLERIRLDLADVDARRAIFETLSRQASKVLIVSEGLLIYLGPAEVGALAGDLAAPATFQRWALDIVSPGLLRLLRRTLGKELGRGGAMLQFGPSEGPDFFRFYGWKVGDVRSMLKTAAALKRLPLFLRLIAALPERRRPSRAGLWSGGCLLIRA